MEVSALKAPIGSALKGPSPLLRLQSDERLITLVRRGQHAAFETLVSRYQSRLLAFCRHMLGSKEDAEDVLQEVFAAAFNAILADERAINVRPWLYRIARNRSLNHLRRASAIGVDSMDVHYAEGGLSTAEKVMRRESFRQLIGDVQHLAETQRTALLLREIDALSYEQIADAMETTVPAVKSLLVRARISLAEAAEARKLTCDEVRLELGEAAEGVAKIGPAVRRHVRDCERCRAFRKQLKDNNVALAMVLPVGPLLLIKKLALVKLGSTAGAGGAHVAGAGGASAAAGAAGGASAGSGLLTAGVGALATKAAAGLAVAAIVTASTVEAEHAVGHSHRHHHSSAVASTVKPAHAREPVVMSSSSQPVTISVSRLAAHAARRDGAHGLAKKAKTAPASAGPAAGTPSVTPAEPVPDPTKTAPVPVTEVTTESTTLPGAQSAPTVSTATTEAPSTNVPATTTVPVTPPAATVPVPSTPVEAPVQPTEDTSEPPATTTPETPPTTTGNVTVPTTPSPLPPARQTPPNQQASPVPPTPPAVAAP